MSKFNLRIMAGALLVILGTCFGANQLQAQVIGTFAHPCPRQPVTGLFDLKNELNRVSRCERLRCAKGLVFGLFEKKQIAQSEVIPGLPLIPLWLWVGLNSHTFSISEQDWIRQYARNVAYANMPPSKFLYSMRFFYTFTVGSPPSYVVGAELTYARCLP